jgi:hypothetical protein
MEKECEILDIDYSSFSSLTLIELKKKYYKLALKHHPDKNGNTEPSKIYFQEINDAYHKLKDCLSEKTEEPEPIDYLEYIYFFMNLQSMNRDQVFQCINLLKLSMEDKLTIKSIEEISKENCIEIYNLFYKYKTLFYVSDKMLEDFKSIIQKKFKYDCVFILHPSLKDLIDHNIYKLENEGDVYLVPLWLQENYFDNKKGGEIIVKCIPELPENISIDENNNILYHLNIPFTKDLLEENIAITIGGKVFEIDNRQLQIKKKQIYIIKQQGISSTCNFTLLKADIIVYIYFS